MLLDKMPNRIGGLNRFLVKEQLQFSKKLDSLVVFQPSSLER
jgi:hypothetical protein